MGVAKHMVYLYRSVEHKKIEARNMAHTMKLSMKYKPCLSTSVYMK